MAYPRLRFICIMLFVAASAALHSTSATTPTFRDVRTLARDFRNPEGVAVDTQTGIAYVADTKNHQLKRVHPSGAVSILAGSGIPGMADGHGHDAQFKAPRGLVFDAAQKVLYVADSANHAIRRVSLTGDVTTLAGSGKPGLRNGNGSAAEFKEPSGIAIDGSGAIYVADTKNNVIRRLTVDGTVTTLAGTGRDGFADGAVQTARFAEPEAIAASAGGVLYVADTRNHRIRKIAGHHPA